jgi:hypothetical protein
MKTQLFLVTLSLIAFSSCKMLIMKSQGIRNPKEETPESLISFLEKRNGPLENNFIFKDSASWLYFSMHPRIHKEVIGTFLFNEHGLILNIKDSTKCQWSGINAISELHPDSTYNIDSTLKIQYIESLLLPLIPGLCKTQEKNSNFTVMMTWARFIGKLNDRIFLARDIVADNPNKNIRLIFINLDMQKSWHLNPDQKVKID